jgi:hypothetical protein
VTPGPDFRELVGDDLAPDEAARLQRVHELLVQAGPPPELSPSLEQAPARPSATVTYLFSRRRKATALLAAAVAAAAFGGGYLIGSGGSGGGSHAAFAAQRVVELRGSGSTSNATVVVRIGKRDSNGNLPILVTSEGLQHLPATSYYTLFMTKHGKPVVACGSFNVSGGNEQTTIRMSVGYSLQPFDGLSVTRYEHRGRREIPLLAGRLV